MPRSSARPGRKSECRPKFQFPRPARPMWRAVFQEGYPGQTRPLRINTDDLGWPTRVIRKPMNWNRKARSRAPTADDSHACNVCSSGRAACATQGSGLRNFCQQDFRLAEPRPFKPLQVARHSSLALKNSLRLLASFLRAALGFQKLGVVEVHFGEIRKLCGLRKERVGLSDLTQQGVRACQQPRRAVVVVARFVFHHGLAVRNRTRGIAKLARADPPTVECIGRTRPRGDGLVITVAGPRVSVLLQQQIAEFLVVSRRGIIEKDRLELLD